MYVSLTDEYGVKGQYHPNDTSQKIVTKTNSSTVTLLVDELDLTVIKQSLTDTIFQFKIYSCNSSHIHCCTRDISCMVGPGYPVPTVFIKILTREYTQYVHNRAISAEPLPFSAPQKGKISVRPGCRIAVINRGNRFEAIDGFPLGRARQQPVIYSQKFMAENLYQRSKIHLRSRQSTYVPRITDLHVEERTYTVIKDDQNHPNKQITTQGWSTPINSAGYC